MCQKNNQHSQTKATEFNYITPKKVPWGKWITERTKAIASNQTANTLDNCE